MPAHRILLELGRGGMGTVYLAVSEGPGGFTKLKVVKQLRDEMAGNAQLLRMFLEEARLAARLSHPNIVQTNEVGFDGRHHFIEMEYLEGQSLDALQRRAAKEAEGVSLVDGAWILSQVLAALEYAHTLTDVTGRALSLVHRDVSPHNVFLTYDGTVKLLDFGIAKAADSALDTATGVIKGKVAYMAPEQAHRRPLDARADVFAVGVMLWQIATGERLWKDLSDFEIYMRLEAGEIPTARSVKESVDEAMDAICRKAMAKDPADRYESAAQMQAALDGWLEGVPVRAGPKRVAALMASLFAPRREAIRREIDAQLRRAAQAPPDSLARVPLLGETQGFQATATDSVVDAAPGGPAPDAAGEGLVPTRVEPSSGGRRSVDAKEATRTAGAIVSDRASTGRGRPSWGWVMVGAIALVGGAGAWIAKTAGPRAASVQAPVDGGSAPHAKVVGGDSRSSNAAAETAYEGGMQALHDGQMDAAFRRLNEAMKLDPTFAAAGLRIVASADGQFSAETAARTMQTTLQYRASLSAHDEALVDAYRYVVLDPPDLAAAEASLSKAAGDLKDPDLAFHLGRIRFLRREYAASESACRAALAADATLAPAWRVLARSALRLGDGDAAHDAYTKCIELQPSATSCLWDQHRLEDASGHCEQAVALARRGISLDPDSGRWRIGLACLIGSVSDPADARRDTEAAFDDSFTRLPGPYREFNRVFRRTALDTAAGDFTRALDDAAKLEAAMKATPALTTYAPAALEILDLAHETHDDKMGARVAHDFLARLPPTGVSDGSMYVVSSEYALGIVDRAAYVKSRDRWLGRQAEQVGDLLTFDLSNRWLAAFAVATVTPGDAREAIDALPSYLPLPDMVSRDPQMIAPLGHVYRLAGRYADARRELGGLVSMCGFPCDPLPTQHGELDLAEMAFDEGDVPGGCAHLERIRRRWPTPVGRSLTLERVRELERRCPPQ